MRIRSLHVSDLTDSGGAEAVFADTLRAAEDLGHHVTALVSDGRRTAASYLWSRRWYREMRTVLARIRPDLVHLHNYHRFLSPSVLLAIRDHRRAHPGPVVVHTAHDYHLVCPNSGFQHYPGGRRTTFSLDRPEVPALARYDHRGWPHSLLRAGQHAWAYRVLDLRREIDLVLSPSELLGRVIRGCGVPAPVRVLRNPVHVAPATGGETGDLVDRVVYLGRVAPEKGLLEFLDAVEQAGIPLRMDVYGTGPSVPALTRRARVLRHADVRLLPRVPRRRVGTTLARYGAMVYPSVWPENAPIAVVEAITAGVPVVVPYGGGVEEVARLSEHWAGFDIGDPASIRRALTTVTADPARRNRMVDPEPFTTAGFTSRLANAYDQVLHEREDRP